MAFPLMMGSLVADHVTLKDIARKTNLSVASVSKALAGYPHVSKSTQRRVQAASEKLNYQPREKRKSASSRTAVKCLVTEDWSREPGHWLAALATAARRVKLDLSVHPIRQVTQASSRPEVVAAMTAVTVPQSTGTQRLSPLAMAELWRQTLAEHSKSVQGLLLFGCFTQQEVDGLAEIGLPCVVVGDVAVKVLGRDLPVHMVNANKYAMGYQATHMLMERGHKRVGFFCAPFPHGGWNEQWLQGYKMAMAESGQKADPQWCQILDTPKRTDVGFEAARTLAALDQPPTAYVTPTVLGAACFRQAMREMDPTFSDEQLATGGRGSEARALGIDHVLRFTESVDDMAIHALDLLARLIVNPTLPVSHVCVPHQIHAYPEESL